ncbi:hypothetical protein [Mucilaginibacter paludis]|uniref:Uncharacterized protein n=1 Tax=Mucilaginibacter paludis DSM 18603 TaxID=714943 RepID=H1Y9P0_9SPHI|nr:hypothetical protein [Mucilaginibacter paludis]EHQ30542.1 hypothetical protein Mucpa_6489 [Mucilaginibacter paludis DSM 18603]
MKIFKLLCFTILAVLSPYFVAAQAKPFKATVAQTSALKKQAQDCAATITQQNYKQLAYYTYPPIIKAMGGADKMVEKLTVTMAQMQTYGVVFKSATVGNINDITKSGPDLYSVVQDILQMANNGSTITASSYVLAISHNNGIRWYFVDTAPLKNQNLKKMFPTYPPGLVIPQTNNPFMGAGN